jgi:sigma-B regulation protein RsbU (phosphoserine phosphatase)
MANPPPQAPKPRGRGRRARRASGAAASAAPPLSLTDFLDVATLQEVQDSFTAVTKLATVIRDAAGRRLTSVTRSKQRALSDEVLEQLLADAPDDGPLIAPITVEGQSLGSIAIENDEDAPLVELDEARAALERLASSLQLPADQASQLIAAAEREFAPGRAAAIQFLYLLANAITRLCFQEHHLRQRVEELSALQQVSTLLSGQRDLQQVMDAASRSCAEVMKCTAAAIRLLNPETREMVPRSTWGLSPEYLAKGAILLEKSPIFKAAVAGEVVYVEDMVTDSRVLYRDDAEHEGLASMLCVGIVYQGRPIGVLQLFTAEVRTFTAFEMNVVKAMSQLVATAIETARLDADRAENQAVMRQLKLAGDVQRRMLPHAPPVIPPFDIAARYVPSFDLGGDFYDFIDLDGNVGIAVGDVVGKGVAASLLMASVRASLRAYAQDVYDIDEVISRVNVQLTRDTLDNEFATLFYGVLSPSNLRMTYCNAGHEPPLLLRRGAFTRLDTGGMIVGIDKDQAYLKAIVHLEPGDLIVLYTDGLGDAMNFTGQRFGRERIEAAIAECADKSAHDTVNHLLWHMRKHTGLNRSFDDTTLVVIRVNQP